MGLALGPRLAGLSVKKTDDFVDVHGLPVMTGGNMSFGESMFPRGATHRWEFVGISP
jgi:hypothetical protein